MYYYVYKLSHIETGDFYFGSRGSKEHPTIDKYLGSMTSWKPDKTKLIREIIKSDFKTREEAYLYERKVIIENVKNILCKNRHIPGIGFWTCGRTNFKNNDGKVFNLEPNDPLIKELALTPYWQGKKHKADSKIKMSESALTRKVTAEGEKKRRKGISLNNKKPKKEEHRIKISEAKKGSKNPMYGKVGILSARAKKILQLDENEVLIKMWDSMRQAENSLGYSRGVLSACLKKNKPYGGFKWSYAPLL